MFDNICNLPLRSDLFTQAIHPTEPIFSVGLSSGHVQTFRLPPLPDASSQQESENPAPSTNGINKSSGSSRGRRSSETGFDTIDTVWQTRRHKGSCRTLAFTGDGATLFSAGTDGIVKAAVTETGKVVGKVAIPVYPTTQLPDGPSCLHVLSPQTFLLGTDTGRLHLFDLRESSSTLTTSSRPSQTFRPHATPDHISNAEPLTSLTPLPPTAASTSGTARTWISTSGSTLAVCDLRKGVVKVSEDQSDELLSSACVSGLGMSKKRRRLMEGAQGNGQADKVLVGGASGVITLWDRGQWEDQSGRVVVHRGASTMDDDGTVEALAVVPDEVLVRGNGFGGKMVVAGLGTGEIKFVRLRGGGGEVVGEVRHDETGVEGVSCLGFDVAGRMISGGGQAIKVWHHKLVGEEPHEGGEEEEEEGEEKNERSEEDEEEDQENEVDEIMVSDEEEESDEESEDDSEDERRKRKKRKKNLGKEQRGAHNILAFEGMD